MRSYYIIIFCCIVCCCTNHKDRKVDSEEVLLLPAQLKQIPLWGREVNDSALERAILGKDVALLKNDLTSKTLRSIRNPLRLTYSQVKHFLPIGIEKDLSNYPKEICIYLIAVKKIDKANTLVVYLTERLYATSKVLACYHNGRLVDTIDFDVNHYKYSIYSNDTIERFHITNNECHFVEFNQFIYSIEYILVEDNSRTHKKDTIETYRSKEIYTIKPQGGWQIDSLGSPNL